MRLSGVLCGRMIFHTITHRAKLHIYALSRERARALSLDAFAFIIMVHALFQVADLVSSEFFEQGDIEREKLNITPIVSDTFPTKRYEKL
jgi:hypothetical protein